MADDIPFAEWINRVRAGDARAAEELVRQYERAVRIAVRVKLTNGKMRRQFDSMDICQSVMGSFFVHAAAGQFELDSPQHLVALLMRMAQNKLKMQFRHHHQQKRDVSKLTPLTDDSPPISSPAAGPVSIAINKEHLSLLLDRLSPDDRELAQRRMLGQNWDEIAREVGSTPAALRRRLSRAVDQAAASLNFDDCASGIGDEGD